jgi:hypothetical protein
MMDFADELALSLLLKRRPASGSGRVIAVVVLVGIGFDVCRAGLNFCGPVNQSSSKYVGELGNAR